MEGLPKRDTAKRRERTECHGWCRFEGRQGCTEPRQTRQAREAGDVGDGGGRHKLQGAPVAKRKWTKAKGSASSSGATKRTFGEHVKNTA